MTREEWNELSPEEQWICMETAEMLIDKLMTIAPSREEQMQQQINRRANEVDRAGLSRQYQAEASLRQKTDQAIDDRISNNLT